MTAPSPKIVFTSTSQNGRSTLEIVCRDATWQAPAKGLPRGYIVPLGVVGGTHAYEFVPDETAGTWCLWGSGQNCHAAIEGAVQVIDLDMQGFGSRAEILALGPVAILRGIGYKGRSSWYTLYREGVEQPLSEGQQLALGLIKPATEPKPVPAPPAVSGAMAEALKRAGL